MKIRAKLDLIGTCFWLGAKETLADPMVLLGYFITYAVLVIAYSGVLKAIDPNDLAPFGLSTAKLVWYLAGAELVMFCGAYAHYKEIQYDIQTDQIGLSLLRPVPFWIIRVSTWVGQGALRAALMGPLAFALVYAIVGEMPFSPVQFLLYVLAFPLGFTIMEIMYLMIGCSCLWFKQSEPIMWITQKFMFFFGALLWPLALYPTFLKAMAWATPFPDVLASPGSLFLNDGADGVRFAHQIGYFFIALYAAAWVSKQTLRRIQTTGGDA